MLNKLQVFYVYEDRYFMKRVVQRVLAHKWLWDGTRSLLNRICSQSRNRAQKELWCFDSHQDNTVQVRFRVVSSLNKLTITRLSQCHT